MLLAKITGALGIVSAVVLVNHVTAFDKTSALVYSLDQMPSSAKTTFGPKELGGIEKNRRHLVADSPRNRNWWNSAYRDRIMHSKNVHMAPSSFFWRVSRGYGYDALSLNRICYSAYSMKLEDIEMYKDWLKSDLESFCTISGQSGTLTFSPDQ